MSITFSMVTRGWPAELAQRLNGQWHRSALIALMAVILAHWVEHITQAVQIFVLGWPRPVASGALGLAFPVLVSSEWLHYAFAVVTLVALLALRPAFHRASATWWYAALVIQVWHHFEHALLLGQALAGMNLFGSPVPTSIIQLIFPRAELHLAYNLLVLIPMVVAMRLHYTDRDATCACVPPRPPRTRKRAELDVVAG